MSLDNSTEVATARSAIDALEASIASLSRDVKNHKKELQQHRYARRKLRYKIYCSSLRIKYFHLLIKFRRWYSQAGFWPLSLMTCGSAALAGLSLIVGLSYSCPTIHLWIPTAAGAASGWLICLHLLFSPRLALINRMISEWTDALHKVKQNHTARTTAVNTTTSWLKQAKKELQLLKRQSAQAQKKLECLLLSPKHKLEQLWNENWRNYRGIDFENFLQRVFEAKGMSVETTPKSGDQGVDLIVITNAWRIAIQVKGYANNVGNGAVQEVIAGKLFHKCNGCAVVTNSQFTKSAKALAESANCQLISGANMKDLITGTLFNKVYPSRAEPANSE